jgi:hypothetical protein
VNIDIGDFSGVALSLIITSGGRDDARIVASMSGLMSQPVCRE